MALLAVRADRAFIILTVGEARPPRLDPYRADVPETVRNAIGDIPLAAETRVTAKKEFRKSLHPLVLRGRGDRT